MHCCIFIGTQCVLYSWQWHVHHQHEGNAVAFPWQHWLHRCAKMLCYVTCMLPVLVTGWSIRLQKVSQDFLSMFCWTLTSFLLLLMAACYSSDQKGGYAVSHCLCSYKKCQSDEIWSPFTSFGPAFDFHL